MGWRPAQQRLQLVCRGCNNGWMSDLQREIKRVLLPLICGERTLLTPAMQAAVATWTAMTVMCAEYFNPSRVAVTCPPRPGAWWRENGHTPLFSEGASVIGGRTAGEFRNRPIYRY
jgi:hypothetical protein